MKLIKNVIAAFVLCSASTALAFDVTNGVALTYSGLSYANGTAVDSASPFIGRVGYFNFDSNITLNNTAIQANITNYSTLNANFVQLYSFNSGQVGATDGTPQPGQINSAFTLDSVPYLALPGDFDNNRRMYFWAENSDTAGAGSQYFIGHTSQNFATAATEFDNAASVTFSQAAGTATVVWGGTAGPNIRTSGQVRPSFQMQAIPEPSTVALVGLALAGAVIFRRRATKG